MAAKNTVQKRLEKARRQFRQTAKRLKTSAAKAYTAGEELFATQLLQRAKGMEKKAEESLIGKKGTKKEREQRAKEALKTLKKSEVTKARKETSVSALRKAKATRQRQEKMFEAKLKNGTITQAEAGLFFSETANLWRGAATPHERLQKITVGTGSANIMEAYKKVMSEVFERETEKTLEEYNAAMNGDYDILKKFGWTDEEINDLMDYDDLGSVGDSPKRQYIINKMLS